MASKCWDGSIIENVTGGTQGPEHDANGDGEYDVLDVLSMRGYLAGKVSLTPAQIKAGDYTGDGKITMADLTKAISLFFDSIA